MSDEKLNKDDAVLSHPAKWQDAHPPEKPYVAETPIAGADIGEVARSPEAPALGSDGLEVDQSVTPDYIDITVVDELENEARVANAKKSEEAQRQKLEAQKAALKKDNPELAPAPHTPVSKPVSKK